MERGSNTDTNVVCAGSVRRNWYALWEPIAFYNNPLPHIRRLGQWSEMIIEITTLKDNFPVWESGLGLEMVDNFNTSRLGHVRVPIRFYISKCHRLILIKLCSLRWHRGKKEQKVKSNLTKSFLPLPRPGLWQFLIFNKIQAIKYLWIYPREGPWKLSKIFLVICGERFSYSM